MRDCCKQPQNREKPVKLSEYLAVELCRECGAKHFEMTVDPVRLGVEGKPI